MLKRRHSRIQRLARAKAASVSSVSAGKQTGTKGTSSPQAADPSRSFGIIEHEPHLLIDNEDGTVSPPWDPNARWEFN